VDLYQASKGKEKEIEMNFAGHSDPEDHMGVDITHLDIFDFFENPNRKTI
jgi:glucan phosphorylase